VPIAQDDLLWLMVDQMYPAELAHRHNVGAAAAAAGVGVGAAAEDTHCWANVRGYTSWDFA
jgi:hypothetical protein